MSDNALAKGYEPKDVEEFWRKRWEEEKTFTPAADAPGEPYSIVIPPPNVTGNLHIGHALNITLQDVLCRFARQQGRKVLWVPGMDHAGIATQNVVERRLAEEGKSRSDLGREKFIERVWDWKEEYGQNIRRQIKAMGASVDWTHERFTMDEGLSRAVRKVFVDLYNKGLIYKGDYIINWCSRCFTALADDEVEHQPQKGGLWHIRYDLEDGSGSLVIATTRPETMLGDTAVAVHPEDERYQSFIGKRVLLPLTDRAIPVIGDKYVDREFGTGALKVTPSHDHNDWELGFKHNLEFIQVIDEHGNMNARAGKYRGLSIAEARRQVVEDLQALGHLVKVEDYNNNVGVCYRCKNIVDPHVSTQWFVATTKIAKKSRDAVPSKTKIFPPTWEKTYYNWLDNIRDWCISRQIWWGHRIPAWTCRDCGEMMVTVDAPAACAKCGSVNLEQESDVLDTWFSSALWPFSTLGWPEKTRDLETFYPTSVLVTGFDILFFWVARMMMMGIEFMGEVPFREVYIHALVRDAEGRKMSKSTGNVINPLEMIDKYGTDALRFTLTAFAAMGRDIKLSEERIEGYRHFANKLWNAARFTLMNLAEYAESGQAPQAMDIAKAEGIHHKWIVSRLENIKAEVKKALEEYRFNDAAVGLYKFIWNELCDWYLELIKPDMQAGGEKRQVAQYTLWLALRETLLLLHPIMPFITAEIWRTMPGHQSGDIAREAFPPSHAEWVDAEAAAGMELVKGVISAVRTIRAELNIAPSHRLRLLIRPQSPAHAAILRENEVMILTLARLESMEISADLNAPKASASAVCEGNEVIVPLHGAIDFAVELARMDKEFLKLEKEHKMLSGKLKNENFLAKAPREIVEHDQARVKELTEAMAKLDSLRSRFREAAAEQA
ncbi:MAG: valine--tRNA ligase [Desulfovibrionaceae bacterium]|nr:valine--tRNA ligase [Desulfovibrionaceae bacterium]